MMLGESAIVYISIERGEVMGKYLSSHSALSELAARLKAYRIDYSLSQKELADKSGVALRSILRMESGEDVKCLSHST
jgi:DNA-binding XRE family transcriptional regulator